MITVDNRAGSAELLSLFPEGLAKLGRLEFGDVCFQGKGPENLPVLVGIERKRIHDFASSIRTGRLQGRQLPGLTASYSFVYLIVEGPLRFEGEKLLTTTNYQDWVPAGGLTVQQFDNFINTLSVLAGIHVTLTTSPRRTVNYIVHLYHWWQKPWQSHKGHRGFHTEVKTTTYLTKPSLLRRIAKELPGIGWERSKLVAKHFKSIREMLSATEKEWQQVEGIGPYLAQQIVKAIHTNASL